MLYITCMYAVSNLRIFQVRSFETLIPYFNWTKKTKSIQNILVLQWLIWTTYSMGNQIKKQLLKKEDVMKKKSARWLDPLPQRLVFEKKWGKKGKEKGANREK